MQAAPHRAVKTLTMIQRNADFAQHAISGWGLKWPGYLVTPQQNVMRDEVKVFLDWLLNADPEQKFDTVAVSHLR